MDPPYERPSSSLRLLVFETGTGSLRAQARIMTSVKERAFCSGKGEAAGVVLEAIPPTSHSAPDTCPGEAAFTVSIIPANWRRRTGRAARSISGQGRGCA